MDGYSTSSVIMDPVMMDNNMYYGDFDRNIFDDVDDDALRGHRGRTDLRTHLEDLARRHPEFAEHLRSPPGWVSDFHSGSGPSSHSGGSSGGRDGSSFYQETSNSQDHTDSPQHNQQPTDQPSDNRPSGINSSTIGHDNLSQHGLRNTDPEIGLKSQAAAKEDRNQRSMSAPPDSRSQSSNADKPQRFVSKIEINPVNPATGETAATYNTNTSESTTGKPPMAPPKPPQQQQSSPQSSQQQQQQQPRQSNVRHIPIFVEGRDEPVLPKNIDQDVPPPPSSGPKHFQTPQQFHQNSNQSFQQPPPTQQQFHHQQQQQQQQQQQPQQTRQEPQVKKAEMKQNENVQQSSEKKQKTFNNDPIFQVQQIQKEVDELRTKINAYSGSSRSDKEYVYLDEMLTRNLIKLDNIEADGKENVRAARKETIKSIQQNISILESKVPQTPITQTPSASSVVKMDVDDRTKENSDDKQGNTKAVAGGSEGTQKMETSNNVSSKSDQSGKKADSDDKQMQPMDESNTEIKC